MGRRCFSEAEALCKLLTMSTTSMLLLCYRRLPSLLNIDAISASSRSVRWRVVGRRRSKAQKRKAKSSIEFSEPAFQRGWILSDMSANRLTFSPEMLTHENPSHDRKFSKPLGLINWHEGWRDKQQRVWDEFLTVDAKFFRLLFFLYDWLARAWCQRFTRKCKAQ